MQSEIGLEARWADILCDGLGDGSERVYGVGVDNVLELEMVLPSGQHVKFSPSKWEDAPGFLYPKRPSWTRRGSFNARSASASRGPSATSECGQVKPVAGPTRRAYGNPHSGAAVCSGICLNF